MAPGKVSKMKQVCAASPGKFASALLDILDGSVEDPVAHLPPPAAWPIPAPTTSDKKGRALLKRPAAALVEEPPAKKAKLTAKEEKMQLEDSKVAVQRRKELKTLKLIRIKDMVSRKGLDLGSKESMIESIIAHEAKRRENVRKHRSNAKDVVVKKREELSGKKNKDLKDLLQAYALHTGGTKPARVERLLTTWQEQGEIEKVLAGMAFQSRKKELSALDKESLYEICRKKGVDALSKDVLVERLLVHESCEIWQEVVEARRQMGGA